MFGSEMTPPFWKRLLRERVCINPLIQGLRWIKWAEIKISGSGVVGAITGASLSQRGDFFLMTTPRTASNAWGQLAWTCTARCCSLSEEVLRQLFQLGRLWPLPNQAWV